MFFDWLNVVLLVSLVVVVVILALAFLHDVVPRDPDTTIYQIKIYRYGDGREEFRAFASAGRFRQWLPVIGKDSVGLFSNVEDAVEAIERHRDGLRKAILRRTKAIVYKG